MHNKSKTKEVLAQRLQALIRSLELRVKLNQEVLHSFSTLEEVSCRLQESPAGIYDIPIEHQALKSEAAIEECRAAIQKLNILKRALPTVDCSAALRLYQESSKLNLKEFACSVSFELRRAG